MNQHITVSAQRWKLGWDLVISPDESTQVRTLDKAQQQVRDYLDTTYPDISHDDWTIDIVPDLGSVLDDIRQAQAASQAAAAAQSEAARQMRLAVRKLRSDGLSTTDVAAILGVSRGRVTQLAA